MRLEDALRWTRFIASAVIIALFATNTSAVPVVIDFDSFTSPPVTGVYGTTGVGGTLSLTGATISGGVVMDGSGWRNLQTSGSNLYGSSQGAQTNFGTLPGTIAIDFTTAIDGLALDIINGLPGEVTITLSLLDAANALIGTVSQSHGSFVGSSAVGHYVTTLTGITRATIVGPTIGGFRDVAIDTIRFDTPAVSVPEPATLALLGIALVTLAFARRALMTVEPSRRSSRSPARRQRVPGR